MATQRKHVELWCRQLVIALGRPIDAMDSFTVKDMAFLWHISPATARRRVKVLMDYDALYTWDDRIANAKVYWPTAWLRAQSRMMKKVGMV